MVMVESVDRTYQHEEPAFTVSPMAVNTFSESLRGITSSVRDPSLIIPKLFPAGQHVTGRTQADDAPCELAGDLTNAISPHGTFAGFHHHIQVFVLARRFWLQRVKKFSWRYLTATTLPGKAARLICTLKIERKSDLQRWTDFWIDDFVNLHNLTIGR